VDRPPLVRKAKLALSHGKGQVEGDGKKLKLPKIEAHQSRYQREQNPKVGNAP